MPSSRPRSGEATTSPITILSANEASCEDLHAVFGTRGDPSRCLGFTRGGLSIADADAIVPHVIA